MGTPFLKIFGALLYRMKRIAWLILCCPVFFHFSCKRPEPVQVKTAFYAIDSLLKAENEAGRFSGSVVIGTADTLLYARNTGLASRVWNAPVNDTTRFDIASVNKSFIALLTLQAVEEGRLNIHDRLADLLKHMDYSGYFDDEITLHHLLTHTSGLPDYRGVSDTLASNGFLRFKRLQFSNGAYVDFISQLKPVGKPGEKFYYSNFAYHLLCILLEEVYQAPFSSILNAKITKPLGLRHTFSTTSNREVFQNVAEGYNYLPGTNKWIRNDFIDLTLGRRIFSSARDLFKWGQAMSNTSLLSTASMDLMHTNHLRLLSDSVSYGYGWVVFGPEEHFHMGDLGIKAPYIIHGGETGGYKAMLVNVDSGRLIVSLLANTGSRTEEMTLTHKIIANLIDNENT